MQIKKVVITGGSGPIGLALIRKLLMENIEILVLQREYSARSMYLPKHELVNVRYCSLENLKSYIPESSDYDIFFHLGWTNTEKGKRDDLVLQKENVSYSCDAVQLAYRCGCHTFIGAGSQAEYGRHEEALKQDTLCKPETAYGVMKLCACHATKILCKKYGIKHIWTRILSGYGIFDNVNSVLVSAILNTLEDKKTEFSKGEQIWDFIYLDDIADALYLIAQKGKNGAIYPIGSGKAKPLKDYLSILYEKLDKKEYMELGKIPYNDLQVMYLKADITVLYEDTGWLPRTEFEDGIDKVISFYKDWKKMWEKKYIESMKSNRF